MSKGTPPRGPTDMRPRRRPEPSQNISPRLGPPPREQGGARTHGPRRIARLSKFLKFTSIKNYLSALNHFLKSEDSIPTHHIMSKLSSVALNVI